MSLITMYKDNLGVYAATDGFETRPLPNHMVQLISDHATKLLCNKEKRTFSYFLWELRRKNKNRNDSYGG